MPSRGFGDGACRDQDDRFAHADDDRAVCLLRVLACFEGKGSAVDFKFSSVHLCLEWCVVSDRVQLATVMLLADAQAADQIGVALRVLALQVVQQAAALADQLEETAARVMIFRVRLEVLGEIADAFAENGDLNFRRAGVGFVRAVRA